MTDPNMMTQLTGAGTIVWLIQELKRSGQFPWLTFDTRRLNRIVSALGALATGAAIHWSWDPTAHAITISGLTIAAISSFLWSAIQQFIGQEMLYQVVYAPKTALKEAAGTLADTQVSTAAAVVRVQKQTVQAAAHEVADAIHETSDKKEQP